MDEYKVYFRQSVHKDFRDIPDKEIKKILQRIKQLGTEPRPPGSEKLTDKEYYRLRQGRYRILYSVQDDEQSVWIVKIGHRKNIYR